MRNKMQDPKVKTLGVSKEDYMNIHIPSGDRKK
jgi:hypothetical protein